MDDRCESDISGVADDDDSDLSSVAGIDDLQLNVGEVVRTYRHQPNPKFNSRLTLLAATTVLLVLGIGIGHYIGQIILLLIDSFMESICYLIVLILSELQFFIYI